MNRLAWSEKKKLFPPFTGSFDLYCDSCSSSPKLTECLQKKKEVIDQMEVKLDTGIDRLVFFRSLLSLDTEAFLRNSCLHQNHVAMC